MAENEQSIHVTGERARAGATPGVTRYILGISMVLVIGVFAIILWF